MKLRRSVRGVRSEDTPPHVVALLEPVSARRGPVVFEDSRWGVTEYDDSFVLVSGSLQSSMEPVPLGCRVVVLVVVVPVHHVSFQVEVGVDPHQLELPPGQVDLVVASRLQGIDGLGREPGLPELTSSEVEWLVLTGTIQSGGFNIFKQLQNCNWTTSYNPQERIIQVKLNW